MSSRENPMTQVLGLTRSRHARWDRKGSPEHGGHSHFDAWRGKLHFHHALISCVFRKPSRRENVQAIAPWGNAPESRNAILLANGVPERIACARLADGSGRLQHANFGNRLSGLLIDELNVALRRGRFPCIGRKWVDTLSFGLDEMSGAWAGGGHSTNADRVLGDLLLTQAAA